jgi:hypothetical protein
MADVLGEAQSSPALAAEAATPAEAPASDLASLLAEYEASTAPKPSESAPQVNPPETLQPTIPDFDLDREMEKLSADMRRTALEKEVAGLTEQVGAARAYIDRQHFDEAVRAIERRLSDSEVIAPANYVAMALMAAAHDPSVAQAFDNRGADPRTYARVMRKLQDKIIADAKMIPDREVTGDVLAVISAMRAATTKAAPERQPDYGSMNDAEFRKELAKHNL